MQELKLKIRHIIIVKGQGTDKISLAVPNDKAIDKVLKNPDTRSNFPELHFDLDFPMNKGEELLAALGLKADEVITLKNEYNFRRLGEKTDAGS